MQRVIAKSVVGQVTLIVSSNGDVIIPNKELDANQLFIQLYLYVFANISTQHFNKLDLNDCVFKMHFLEYILNSYIMNSHYVLYVVSSSHRLEHFLQFYNSFFVDQARGYSLNTGIQCDITYATLSFLLVRRHPTSSLLFKQAIKLPIQGFGSALGAINLDNWLTKENLYK